MSSKVNKLTFVPSFVGGYQTANGGTFFAAITLVPKHVTGLRFISTKST